jgi:hypothetical protein
MWGWLAGLLSGAGGTGAAGAAVKTAGQGNLFEKGVQGLLNAIPDDKFDAMNARLDQVSDLWNNRDTNVIGAIAEGAGSGSGVEALAGGKSAAPANAQAADTSGAYMGMNDFRQMFSNRERPSSQRPQLDPVVSNYLKGLLGG